MIVGNILWIGHLLTTDMNIGRGIPPIEDSWLTSINKNKKTLIKIMNLECY